MSQRILVVDDEPDAAEALKEMLLGAGYQVETVETAKDAISKSHASRPDLLLIDIGLPDGNGMFLANMLGSLHQVPIVIVTGLPSFRVDEPDGSKNCINSVVFKPCSSRTLLRAVEEALGGSAAVTF
jgi:DNA-binding response OmpR family regulator